MPEKIEKRDLVRAGQVVDEIDRLSEARKILYGEHDQLAVKLRRAPKALLKANDLVLKKPFKKGNTQWGHGPVRELQFARPKAEKKSGTA